MSGEKANMTADRFEEAMERSFLFWLQYNIPSITITTDTGSLLIPTQVLNCMPHEYYLKERGDKILLDVRFKSKGTEGYNLGQTHGHYRTEDSDVDPAHQASPWTYNIDILMSVFSPSSVVRSRVDGKIRDMLQGLRSGYVECPVYEWNADISAVTAFDTGAFLSVVDNKDEENVHAEDEENNDFLSHWSIKMKCPFVIDSSNPPVTAFDLTQTINNLLQ
jgi:hypothetical protein